MLSERYTEQIAESIAKGLKPIEAQYKRAESSWSVRFHESDPLGEESKYSPAKGLVHKYNNRLLWKTSYRCAAHCQFCTRARQIGSPDGDLTDGDIELAFDYIRSQPQIEDVILSGGDPFYTPRVTDRILKGLAQIETVRVIRIGTRLPVQSPSSFQSKPLSDLMQTLEGIVNVKPVIVLIHFNHPVELTADVLMVVKRFRQLGLTVLSQTVFLRGINDSFDVLKDLFRKLYHAGVIPYYIYRCDAAAGLEPYVCDAITEREIMTRLTSELSGIAVPTYVLDVRGRGKIPVPLGYWQISDLHTCQDYDGTWVATDMR